MNQDHIGKFIAKLRKENNLTQQELANKLGITDRAVSHWENGRSMPDVSLFKDICEILGVSVSELINGEKISKDEIVKKSDEHIINTLKENKKQKKKSISIISILVLGITLLLVILLLNKRANYPKIDLFNFTIQPSDHDIEYILEKQLRIDERDIYYYGIDLALFCDKNDNCYLANDALKHKQMSLDYFKDYLEKQVEYENYKVMRMWDGGTTIYQKSGMQIIYCNTIDGNKDVYIGNDSMLDDINGGYCGHLKNEDESYIRTYKVISSAIDKNDSEFNYVTLEQNNGDKGKVLIHNSYLLIPGHTYEFSFLTFDKFEDTVENIFKYSILLNAIETYKVSFEQINDRIIVNDNLDNDTDLNELKHVRMDIVEGTLTPTSAKVKIKDLNNYKYLYGEYYRLDKKVNDKWEELPLKNLVGFNDIGYFTGINGYLELDINWEYAYGELSKGKYRIVKYALMNLERPCVGECKRYYFSVEFDMN